MEYKYANMPYSLRALFTVSHQWPRSWVRIRLEACEIDASDLVSTVILHTQPLASQDLASIYQRNVGVAEIITFKSIQ